MDPLTFTVVGQPVAQPRPRISTWGGRGRAYVEARHPIHGYRAAIVLMAQSAAAASRHKRLEGPVSLEVVATFERPPSHLTKSGRPRDTAPSYPPRNDWDNLGKAVSDAITDSGVVWCDDDQVVDSRVQKRYAVQGEIASTVVTVRALGVQT